MSRRAASALLACSLAWLWPGPARAGVADAIGLGPQDVAQGGAFAAQPGSFAAVYYNPAALAPGGKRAEDRPGFGELTLGLVYAHPVLHVTAPDGTSVPLAAPTPDTAGLLVGARADLGRPFGLRGLDLGLAFYFPDAFFRWSIHPDERAQWLFLTDRTQVLGIDLGLGYRAASWLSLGLGLGVLFDVETFTTGQVQSVASTTDPETGKKAFAVTTRLGEEVTVYGRAAPSVGLLLTPAERLRLGLVYRAKTLVDDWGNTRIRDVPAVGELGSAHRFAHYFRPHEVVFAVSAALRERLWLSADLTYGRWSEALTTYHQALGPGRFGDTWKPALGLLWRARPGLELRGGYRFVRSPFDNFGGPTNLLDCDEHVLSTGASVRLGTLDAGETMQLWAHFAARAALLGEREERKDPRRFVSDTQFLLNPGREGYRYGGAVPGAVLALEARW
ncbi:MAG: outer membrane protein transport protein [Deltaproteobacteria bacterium]|nr:outer membrane protein transport protein [Deltaproteobacteria bacterium]